MTYPTFTDDERERLGNEATNQPAVTNDASWAAHNPDVVDGPAVDDGTARGEHEADDADTVDDTDASLDTVSDTDRADVDADDDTDDDDDLDDDDVDDDDAEARADGADTLILSDDDTDDDSDEDDSDDDLDDDAPVALTSDTDDVDDDDEGIDEVGHPVAVTDADDDDVDENDADDVVAEPDTIAPTGDETLVVDDADIEDSADHTDDDTIDDDVDPDTAAAIDAEAADEAGNVTTVDPGVMTEDVVVAEEVDEDNCASPALTDTTVDGEPVIDGHIVEPVAVTSGMRPGDAPLSETMTPPADAAEVHERWQQAQLGFIDDPQAATEAARAIATEALESHIEALRARQAELDSWQGEGAPDTEVLRAAMRGYRDMVTSLTGI